jgi:Domain of unknown function (DUF4385)
VYRQIKEFKGYTRSRRYANPKSGRKYSDEKKILPYQEDKIKAESAAIFKEIWQKAKQDPDYIRLKQIHQKLYG